MHILFGAIAGAVVAVVVTVAVAVVMKRELRARDVLLSAAAGALGGAVISATLGVGGGAALTSARSLTAFGAGGATMGGSEQLANNVLDDRPLHEGVAEAAAIGGAAGVLMPVAAKGLGKAWQAGVRQLRKAPSNTAVAGTEVTSSTAGSEVASTATHANPTLASSTTPATLVTPNATTPASSTLATSSTTTANTTLTHSAGSTTTTVTATDSTRGVTQILSGKPGKTRNSWFRRSRIKAYASIHPRAPAWLRARFAHTLDRVRAGHSGPKARPADVERFLHETYEHVNEVNALIKALGGRTRPIPKHVAPGTRLTGVHDFGERASIKRVEELIAQLRRNPPRDKNGVALEVPEWLLRLPREARAAGKTTIDVGKSSPQVAAGLGRAGPPEPFAIRLHNLSAHHQQLANSTNGKPSNVLIEEVADALNAMRQARIYRPEPIPFTKIEKIFKDLIAKGVLPDDATPLVRRAIRAQRRLERTSGVNPYHLIPSSQAPPGGLASVDPRDLGRLAFVVMSGSSAVNATHIGKEPTVRADEPTIPADEEPALEADEKPTIDLPLGQPVASPAR